MPYAHRARAGIIQKSLDVSCLTPAVKLLNFFLLVVVMTVKIIEFYQM